MPFASTTVALLADKAAEIQTHLDSPLPRKTLMNNPHCPCIETTALIRTRNLSEGSVSSIAAMN